MTTNSGTILKKTLPSGINFPRQEKINIQEQELKASLEKELEDRIIFKN